MVQRWLCSHKYQNHITTNAPLTNGYVLVSNHCYNARSLQNKSFQLINYHRWNKLKTMLCLFAMVFNCKTNLLWKLILCSIHILKFYWWKGHDEERLCIEGTQCAPGKINRWTPKTTCQTVSPNKKDRATESTANWDTCPHTIIWTKTWSFMSTICRG